MGEILSVKLWNPAEYTVKKSGKVVRMSLKRLNALKAAPLVKALAHARRAFAATMPKGSIPELAEDATNEQRLEWNSALEGMLNSGLAARSAYFEAMSEELIRDLFANAVRITQDGTLIVDGEPINDGPGLLEIADHDMLAFILTSLESLCSLSYEEGKASASPSTSGLAAEANSGDSPAPSTEPEASTSTAPVIPPTNESPTSPSV